MNDPIGWTTPGEREAPRYFAGRREELATLHRRLERTIETGAAKGGIQLVVGAPSMGKTQLAERFGQLAVRRRGSADIRRLGVDPSMLAHDTGLFLSIAKALGRARDGARIAGTDGRRTLVGVKVDMSANKPRRADSLYEMLTDSVEAGMWKNKALVIVLDELQTADEPACWSNLRMLHQGEHGCPILLVGVGLQHLPRKLAQNGISRVAAPLRLTVMSRDDAVVAVERNLAAIDFNAPRKTVETLASASFGFPLHINRYLSRAERAFAEHGHVDAGPVLDRVIEAGDADKTDYYKSRLATLVHRKAGMLPIVAEMIGRGVSELPLYDAAKAAGDFESR